MATAACSASSAATHRASRGGVAARADRLGVTVSALCIVHCVLTASMVGSLATLGLIASPAVHHAGLMLATLFALVSLVRTRPASGARRWLVGGVALLGAGVVAGHGWPEIMLSIAGALAVAIGHWRR